MGNKGIIYPYPNRNTVLAGATGTTEICTKSFSYETGIEL